MNKRILVTGSSGFIGRWVVAQLKQAGYQVIGIDKVEPAPTIGLDEHVTCNILNRDLLISEVRRIAPDALIHLAARVDLDEVNDIKGYADNIDGVRNLIEAVRQTSSIHRAIYTSSQLVCRVGYIPKSDVDYCPSTLYGRSKVLTETIVMEEDGGGIEWCLTRPTTIWGPYMSLHYQKMLRFIQKGLYFHAGNSKLYKSYGYVGNTAFQYIQLLNADAGMIHQKTLYISDYQPLSLREYIDDLASEMGGHKILTLPLFMARCLAITGDVLNKCGFKNFPFNSFRLNNILTEYTFDMAKTENICGQLPFTMKQGVKKTAEWFLMVGDVSRKTNMTNKKD
jgi:GlcNAc-P-P-Und epimerase